MELYFQEKFSFKDKVEITDADGNVIYTGKRGFFDSGLTLKDAEGNKVVTLIEYNGAFKKCFVIKKGKKKVAKMKKKLSLIGQKLHIKKLDWDVKGNFIAKEYTITKGDEVIAEITKKKMISLLEAYAININNDENVAEVLGVTLALNQILKKNKKKLLKK